MDENKNRFPLNNGGNNNGDNNRRQPVFMFILFTLIAIFITTMIYSSVSTGSQQEVAYSKFYSELEEGKVKSVTFSNHQIQFTLKKG